MNEQHYEKCLRNGCSPRLAEMLASRRAPGCVTDDTFFVGRKGGQQFADDPQAGDYLAAGLRKLGGSPAVKVYVHGLARFPGDPEAWVSSRGEIADRCRERGWNCKGQVNVKGDQYAEPKPDIPLDPDLVTEEVAIRIAENPEIAPTPKDKERLWHETYEQRKPNRKPKQTVVDPE